MTRANDVSSVAFRIWSREALSWLHLTVTWEDIKSPGVHAWTK